MFVRIEPPHMYDTVLVPTDGSDHSVRAAEHGLNLAAAFDAAVHVLSVVDVQGAAGVFDAGGVDEEFIANLENDAEDAIGAVEAVVDDPEAVTTATVRGRPSEGILEYATDHGADAIAMGTHGRTGLNRYIAGSVTERVVRLADVPVLTARATEQSRTAGSYDEILLPTDGSDYAAAAVEHGVAIARETGARIHAVNVVDVGAVSASPNYALPTGIVEELVTAGEAAAEEVAASAREEGVDATTAVQEGLPGRDLLAYAEENDVDLVAMGTAGRTGLSRHLLGSTTERIIRHADVPVLAVNAREQDT
jgi:nucleotide-binding universal stress UspA family protein